MTSSDRLRHGYLAQRHVDRLNEYRLENPGDKTILSVLSVIGNYPVRVASCAVGAPSEEQNTIRRPNFVFRRS